jgi:hypothetical protein
VCTLLALLAVTGFVVAIVFAGLVVGLYMAFAWLLWLAWRFALAPALDCEGGMMMGVMMMMMRRRRRGVAINEILMLCCS